jgi:hypothetical protein
MAEESRIRRREDGEVLLGERALRGDADLVLLAEDGDGAAEHPSLAIDLDAVVEDLLEGDDVHDLVLDGLAAVDGKGLRLLLAFGGRTGQLLGLGSRHGEALREGEGRWWSTRETRRSRRRAQRRRERESSEQALNPNPKLFQSPWMDEVFLCNEGSKVCMPMSATFP